MIGYIYKIVNDIDNSFYVGSTWFKLNIRFSKHKNDCNSGSIKKVHRKMREVGTDHCRIELIEQVEVQNKQERLQIEQKYINELKPDLNVNKAFQTKLDRKNQNKKWYQTHKEQKKKAVKNYREEHMEQVKEYNTKYCKDHSQDYSCELCKFVGNKASYDRHCKTNKHLKNFG